MSSHATNFMYTNYFDALCAVVLSNRERVRVRFGVRVGYFERGKRWFTGITLCDESCLKPSIFKHPDAETKEHSIRIVNYDPGNRLSKDFFKHVQTVLTHVYCAIGDVAFSSYQFQTLSCSCGLSLEPAAMETFQLKNLNPAQLFQLLFLTVLELAERFQINLRGRPRVFMREEPDEENPPEAVQPAPVPAHGPVRARRCQSACRFCVQGCDRTKPYHKHHACQGHAHLRI